MYDSSVKLNLKIIKMDIDKFFNKVNPFEWETTEPKEYRDFGKNDMIKFAKMYVEAINYTHSCKSDSELLVCDCATPFVDVKDINQICQKCLKLNENAN